MFDRFAYGSTQAWGMAPACELEECKNTLLIDTGDLRYYYRNITKNTNFYIMERNLPVLARALIKILILFKIQLIDSQEEALQLAHCYAEMHFNLYVSQDTVKVLQEMFQLMLDFLAERKTDNPLISMLKCQVDLSALKMSELDDLYKFYEGRLRVLDKEVADRESVAAVEENKKTYKLLSKAEKYIESYKKSYDDRQRAFYGDRYDRRAYVCLWDYTMNLGPKLFYVHEIFYQAFRAGGVPYLKPYYRLPACLGGQRQSGVGRRAPTTEESRAYCGYVNAALMAGNEYTFDAEMLVGPWFETCWDLWLNDEGKVEKFLLRGESQEIRDENKKEGASDHFQSEDLFLKRQGGFAQTQTKRLSQKQWRDERLEEYRATFTPAGPDSVEPILSLVEISAQNVLELGSNFYCPERKISFLTEKSLQKSKFEKYFDQIVLSIEGVRFLGKSKPAWMAEKTLVHTETAQFIPTVDAKAFEEKLQILVGKDIKGEFCDQKVGERIVAQKTHYHFEY